MRLITLISVLLALGFSACNKKESTTPTPPVNVGINNGMGDGPTKIHGYLYASYKKTVYSGSGNYFSSNLYALANFGDPKRNLMSNFDHAKEGSTFFSGSDQPNVSVGTVNFSGLVFNNSSTTNYFMSSTQYALSDLSPSWSTRGNGPFKPISISLPRLFPQITSTSKGDTTSRNNDYTIQVSNFISNYDSVVVRIQNTNFEVSKRIGKESNTITFTKGELASMYSSYCTISYMAFNYSNMTVEDKKYVFELGNKLDLQLYIKY